MSVFLQVLSQNICLESFIPGVKCSELFGHKRTSNQTFFIFQVYHWVLQQSSLDIVDSYESPFPSQRTKGLVVAIEKTLKYT